jgi:2-C-methyl-D-erythritol 2,4-cyclodiphosphate synthase
LKDAVKLIREAGYDISNIDAQIIAQKPKMAKYIPEMRKIMAEIIGIDFDDITVKATTTEKMGFTGRGEGIAALATCTLVKP